LRRHSIEPLWPVQSDGGNAVGDGQGDSFEGHWALPALH
jgi:hypothetical protein